MGISGRVDARLESRTRLPAGANARFTGDFLEAVDSLLADPATRRTLVATAFAVNRHLVIEEAR